MGNWGIQCHLFTAQTYIRRSSSPKAHLYQIQAGKGAGFQGDSVQARFLPWSSHINLTRPVSERNSQAVSQRWIYAPPRVYSLYRETAGVFFLANPSG